jgi:cytochrome c oxidase subunit II
MNEARGESRHIWRAATIWVIASVITEAIYLVIAPQFVSWGVLPPIGSARVEDVNSVLFLFTALSIPVFMMVVVFAAYGVFTFRTRGRPVTDGPMLRGHIRLQWTWVAISVLLVAFLFGYGLYFLSEVSAAPSGDVLIVNVTGEQWLWDYSYPQYNNVSGTTLELQVNRPVKFVINSIDVQHSFWIPSFEIKQDAVPGQTTTISVTPSTIGDYVVRCAELCGLYHAYMETPVHVVSASDFAAWAQQQQVEQPSGSQSLSGALPMAMVSGSGRRSSSAYGG